MCEVGSVKKRQAEAISAAGSTSSSLHSDQFQAPDSQILRQIQRKLRSDFSAAADVLATNLRRMSVVEVVELQGQCCGASL